MKPTNETTPWVAQGDIITAGATPLHHGQSIADCASPEVAAHIVKCVNAHDSLLLALCDLVAQCDSYAADDGDVPDTSLAHEVLNKILPKEPPTPPTPAKVSRQELADALVAEAQQGCNISAWVAGCRAGAKPSPSGGLESPGPVNASSHSGEVVRAHAEFWARMCKGITCVEVHDAGVSYTQPGSRGYYRARIIFTPDTLSEDSLEYLARYCDRLVCVEEDNP